jgi:hypothetical protein
MAGRVRVTEEEVVLTWTSTASRSGVAMLMPLVATGSTTGNAIHTRGDGSAIRRDVVSLRFFFFS